MAETHAVVVGIDDYINVRKLQGAVADAEDIYATLKKSGVKDVTPLYEGDATRKAILDAIDQLIARTRKDDLAIITIAGHGAQELWGTVRPPGTKMGQPHEVYLLRNVKRPDRDGKIDPNQVGSGSERIFGVEFATRLKRLNELGARTIFVADTCHGGGQTREPVLGAPSTFASERVDRNIVAYADGVDPLQSVIAGLPATIDTDKELRSLTFLAAVDRTSAAPEVEIPKGSGKMRGALSYAFARLIEGDASRGGAKDLTHGEIIDYMLTSISNSVLDSGKGQEPDLRPRGNFDRVVIKFGTDLAASSIPASTTTAADSVRIFSTSGKPVDVVKRPQRGFAIQTVSNAAEADLSYNPASGDVFSKGGDLIAMRVAAGDLEGVAEREVAVRRLVELAKPRARLLKLAKGDRRYVEDEYLSLDARRSDGAPRVDDYYVLIFISGDGKVQFQYPRRIDPPILPVNYVLRQMQASEPFGADYAIFVSDEKPIDGLVKSLCQLDGRKEPNLVVSLIERALTPTMQIGLKGIYTVPRVVGAPVAAETRAPLCSTAH